MFKTIIGLVIGYGVFNENGRKFMNDMGNKLIDLSKKGVENIGNNNKSSNCQSNGVERSNSEHTTSTNSN